MGIESSGVEVRTWRARSAEAPSDEAAPGCPPDPDAAGHRSLSPQLLSYLVGPLALGLLLLFRHFGLVSRLPVWVYVAAFGAVVIAALAVEPWQAASARSLRGQARLGVHVVAVSTVIYMSGWGPALALAYAFVAIYELELCGSAFWKSVLYWTLLNILVGQALVWYGLVPCFLSRGQAATIGALGAFVVAIIIRMAGATGEKKERAESLLAHQALHDMLTGLPNRAYFYERTDRALSGLGDGSATCAVMLFDLDRFKEINDTMGHRYGDRVLIEVGPRVTAVLRRSDTLARLGGDEFCVLLPRVADRAEAFRVAERIIAVLEQPFDIDGISLGIEASCGIALAPAHGLTADLLLQRADVAMYSAKESSSSVVVFSDELGVNTPERLALLGDLRNAVAREEFVLHYQPKASMATRRVEGAEALIRWQHPTMGLLYPDSFIPEAERSGLIEPMTVWVLNEALRQCRRWLDDAGPSDPSGLSIAVNLSTRSLLDSSLPRTVADALARWEVPARLLDLEITETIIMTDPKRALEVLTELARMGVTLSIDDFGTGYSSLAYLRDLPVHQLKVDRTFVQDMADNSGNAVIVRAVVDLARNLGLATVAEGVEDEATWEQLTQLGCTSAQGYFLARPMPADLFWGWLKEYGRTWEQPARAAAPGRMTVRPGLTTSPQ